MADADLAFAIALREQRHAARISQRQLAENMCATGRKMHQTSIAKIESGDRTVSVGEAVAIAGIIGVPLAHLIGGEMSPDVADRMRAFERQLRARIADQILAGGPQ